MRAATERVQDILAAANFHVELIPTDGPPLVYAESPVVAGKLSLGSLVQVGYVLDFLSGNQSIAIDCKYRHFACASNFACVSEFACVSNAEIS